VLAGLPNSDESHQLPDDETNMTIPTDLVTMERRDGSTSEYDIVYMTSRIANIVVDVQQEKRTGQRIGGH
jgi:hypothetical protein